jgi:hypothetical protein
MKRKKIMTKVSVEKQLEKLELKKSWIEESEEEYDGKKLSYMEPERYITLLNKIVGFGQWNWTVGEPKFITSGDKIISVYIKSTLHIKNLDITREGWGTSSVKYNNVSTAIKVAESDGLKRVCRTLNIGLQLYTTPEKREAEKRLETEEKIFNRIKEAIDNREFNKTDIANVVEPTSKAVLDYVKKNGNDVEKLCQAIVKAKENTSKPLVKTK